MDEILKKRPSPPEGAVMPEREAGYDSAMIGENVFELTTCVMMFRYVKKDLHCIVEYLRLIDRYHVEFHNSYQKSIN